MSFSDLIPWKKNSTDIAVQKDSGDPFMELQRRMNSLFDDFWGDFPTPLRSMRTLDSMGDFSPAIEFSESENELKMKAEIPGIDEKDIEVELSDGLLTIKGEKKTERKEETNGTSYSECSYGSFRRSVELPYAVKEDNVSAEFKNGVLTVVLPKNKEAKSKSKRIDVNHN